MSDSFKKVGLVLGGGGARGMAHLGVLQSMEKRGYRADAIAGCSMGGIVGAQIANGMAADDIVGALRDLNELELLDFGAMGGIIGGKKGVAVGAAVGGGAGTATVLTTKGKEVEFQPEHKFSFSLSREVEATLL